MKRLADIFRVIFACAGFGVLIGLLAVVVSIVLSIHGTQNHMSPVQLAWICFVGAALSLPLVLLKLSRSKKRKAD